MGFLLAALAGGFLFFNSQASPGKVEGAVTSALQRILPNSQVRVQVEGKRGKAVLKGRFKRVSIELSHLPGASLKFPIEIVQKVSSRGHIEKLEVHLRDFTAGGLHIEAADLHFDDVDFDWKALRKTNRVRLLHLGKSTAQVRLKQDTLQSLISTRLPDLQNVGLKLEDGMVRVTGEKSVLGLTVPFAMSAIPTAHGNQIRLDKARVQMEGLPLSVPLESVLANLNPIFVFDREDQWPIRVRLTNVQAVSGELNLSAELEPNFGKNR